MYPETQIETVDAAYRINERGLGIPLHKLSRVPKDMTMIWKKGRDRRLWALVPPWLIIGAVVILVPFFLFITMESITRQEEQTTRLLVEKGAALIRSFEAGARTGIGLKWGGFQLQKLLMETAREPDIDYLIVTDVQGTILADSDPSRLGMRYGLDLELSDIAKMETLAWRQVPNSEGADTFEIYRQFAPTSGPLPRFPDPTLIPPGSPDKEIPGFVIFVGLDMGPILAAQKEDKRRTIWMAVVLLLIGFAGIVSLLLAQGYRTARSSLSRIKAFSDSLVENMPIGLAAFDSSGTLTAFNQTAETTLNRKAAATIGKPAGEILPETLREIFLELTSERRIIEREIECTVTEDRTLLLEVIATTLQEDDGAFLGYVLLFRDMTEVRRLQQEITRNRSLASLGSLAAGVAHEIRNPLSSLKGFATYFRERYRYNPADRETAEVMITEVDRLNRVISQLLEFARPMTMTLVPTPLSTVIRHALKMVEGQAREKRITIEIELPPEIWEIPLDADRVSQVLMNLFLNAFSAMEAGGTLRVSLTRQDDRMIRISVSDTGIGIQKEDLPRVFDPYFTTKASGTGLGLPIVQKIIEAHKGKILLSSEPGKGTTATILLPTQSGS
jgi:two-component system sensor histidine kinase HydH